MTVNSPFWVTIKKKKRLNGIISQFNTYFEALNCFQHGLWIWSSFKIPISPTKTRKSACNYCKIDENSHSSATNQRMCVVSQTWSEKDPQPGKTDSITLRIFKVSIQCDCL